MGCFLGLFCCLAGFVGLFWCGFATVQLLNSYCLARGVGGGGFRVFFGFLSLRGGLERFGWRIFLFHTLFFTSPCACVGWVKCKPQIYFLRVKSASRASALLNYLG